MPEPLSFTAPDLAGRLDRWLAGELPISRSRLQDLIGAGGVAVDGQTVRSGHRLRGGEQVTVVLPDPPEERLFAQDLGVPVLYQDASVIVVDKPAGLVVHPAPGHRDGTLVNALLPDLSSLEGEDAEDANRPGIVHRIDRGTSGVLVVARTPDAHTHLSAQFAEHSTERRYLALVWGCTRDLAGTIDAPLGRHPTDRKRFAVRAGGRRAVTHWWRLAEARLPDHRDGGGALSLIQCKLDTGRTHQVRVHLEHLGVPVVGDPVYGRKRPPPAALAEVMATVDHTLLHAWVLAFTHPVTGERMRFETPPPPDFLAVLAAVGLALPTHAI